MNKNIFALLIAVAVIGTAFFFGMKKNNNPTSTIAPELLPMQFELYRQMFNVPVQKLNKLTTSVFSSGKIVFIKDGNLWWSEPNGATYSITDDATKNLTRLLKVPLNYSYPLWSPDGSKVAFSQSVGGVASQHAQILVTDGQNISTDSLLDYYTRLPLFWMDSNRLITPNVAITTATFKGIKWDGVNRPGSPYFSGYNTPNGCGGRCLAWECQLNQDHNGILRSTFLYLSDQQTVVYSTGCKNEDIEKISLGSQKAVKFDPTSKNGAPQSLMLSPDNKTLVGIINGNVVLYDTGGQLIKQLTNSGKAYDPVFSSDGKTIFYADNYGSQPNLGVVNLDGSGQQIIYNSPKIGAITNISVSPDNKQLVFTLIYETKPDGEVKTSLYLINADGSNPVLFVDNAEQGAWSPK